MEEFSWLLKWAVSLVWMQGSGSIYRGRGGNSPQKLDEVEKGVVEGFSGLLH